MVCSGTTSHCMSYSTGKIQLKAGNSGKQYEGTMALYKVRQLDWDNNASLDIYSSPGVDGHYIVKKSSMGRGSNTFNTHTIGYYWRTHNNEHKNRDEYRRKACDSC